MLRLGPRAESGRRSGVAAAGAGAAIAPLELTAFAAAVTAMATTATAATTTTAFAIEATLAAAEAAFAVFAGEATFARAVELTLALLLGAALRLATAEFTALAFAAIATATATTTATAIAVEAALAAIFGRIRRAGLGRFRAAAEQSLQPAEEAAGLFDRGRFRSGSFRTHRSGGRGAVGADRSTRATLGIEAASAFAARALITPAFALEAAFATFATRVVETASATIVALEARAVALRTLFALRAIGAAFPTVVALATRFRGKNVELRFFGRALGFDRTRDGGRSHRSCGRRGGHGLGSRAGFRDGRWRRHDGLKRHRHGSRGGLGGSRFGGSETARIAGQRDHGDRRGLVTAAGAAARDRGCGGGVGAFAAPQAGTATGSERADRRGRGGGGSLLRRAGRGGGRRGGRGRSLGAGRARRRSRGFFWCGHVSF